jgi:hypothetical protein
MTYKRWRLTISSRGVGDIFTTLAATISRISNGKVVMFTPLILQLSISRGVASCFVGSSSGDFYDLGIEEEEERNN